MPVVTKRSERRVLIEATGSPGRKDAGCSPNARSRQRSSGSIYNGEVLAIRHYLVDFI